MVSVGRSLAAVVVSVSVNGSSTRVVLLLLLDELELELEVRVAVNAVVLADDDELLVRSVVRAVAVTVRLYCQDCMSFLMIFGFSSGLNLQGLGDRDT